MTAAKSWTCPCGCGADTSAYLDAHLQEIGNKARVLDDLLLTKFPSIDGDLSRTLAQALLKSFTLVTPLYESRREWVVRDAETKRPWEYAPVRTLSGLPHRLQRPPYVGKKEWAALLASSEVAELGAVRFETRVFPCSDVPAFVVAEEAKGYDEDKRGPPRKNAVREASLRSEERRLREIERERLEGVKEASERRRY